jgi:CRISPR-associated endonuclease/helicase Cas3
VEKGKEMISELCSTQDLEEQFRLLRLAQQFTVNLFPETLRCLQQKGAIHEAQAGTGVLYLEDSFYSDEFGLSLEGSERMEGLFA